MNINFQCNVCGSNYSISESGITATTVILEEIGGAGTSGANDVKNWPVAQELKDKWGMLGLNNHEEASLKIGYDNIVSEYTKLKLKILESRDNACTLLAKKIYYEGLLIYIYSVYENLFYGYMISCASSQRSAFIFKDKCKKFPMEQQYYNHLPSFSSALLHFGNCRDLIFVLVRLANNQSLNDANDYNKIMDTRRYYESDFCNDLKNLCNDSLYIAAGKEIFKLHRFRNIYEHKFRLLWSPNNIGNNDIYFIKRDLYNAIVNDEKDNIKKMLFSILEDRQKYENEIFNSNNSSEIISSQEILINIHDKISSFFNNTLIHISRNI